MLWLLRLLDPEDGGAGIEEAVEVGGVGFAEALEAVGTAEGVLAEGPEERTRAELGARVLLAAIVADARRRKSTGDSGEEGSTVCLFSAERSSSMVEREERGLLNCGAGGAATAGS